MSHLDAVRPLWGRYLTDETRRDVGEGETTRHERIYGDDPPVFQAFYKTSLERSGWRCASAAVPAIEYAVRHALLDAERHRLNNMQAELEIEYLGETPFPGYPVTFIEYAIVRLKRTPFWCCTRLSAMGTVVERFGVNLKKVGSVVPYEICVPSREPSEDE